MILGFDIDGVIATENYLKPYGKPQGTWNMYYARVEKIPGAKFLNQLYQHHRVVLITGRLEGARKATVTWLEKKDVPYHRLYLRKNMGKSIEEHKIEAVIREKCDRYFDNRMSIIRKMKVQIPNTLPHHFKSWDEVHRILGGTL
jgi:uncharacterized HAD superfamily protein